jgi:cardiolipin synthase
MKGRTTQGIIAWSICLVLFPFVTIPFYLFFGGRKFHGYVKARRKDDSKLRDTGTLLFKNIQQFISENSTPWLKALENIARMPSTTGNEVDVLINGEAKFNAVYEELARAESYILVQYYMVKDDSTGQKFKETLISKVQEGVKVYFLYDAIGSYELSGKYLEELSAGGVKVVVFGKYRFVKNKFQLNFRNHRKIIIVDGQTAFCGGLNVGDEYMGLNENYSPWRDTHLKISGPAVLCLQLTFLEDWFYMENNTIKELSWNTSAVGDSQLLVLPTGPADELDSCSHAFITACNAAEKCIWVSTPYFVPSPEVASALQAASLRGVEVKVLVPSKADNLLVHLSSSCFINDVSKYNIKFFRYTKGFLHQKAFIIDDKIAAIGTVNLDNRSFSLNFEMMVYGFSKSYISTVRQIFETDFSGVEQIPDNEFDNKPFKNRLIAKICRLLSPLQ